MATAMAMASSLSLRRGERLVACRVDVGFLAHPNVGPHGARLVIHLA
jgi:hypothetical protein